MSWFRIFLQVQASERNLFHFLYFWEMEISSKKGFIKLTSAISTSFSAKWAAFDFNALNNCVNVYRKANGTLDFSTNVLKRRNDNTDEDEEVPPAPKRVSNQNGRCSCKTGCKNNRCICRKNNSVSFLVLCLKALSNLSLSLIQFWLSNWR